MPTKFYVVHHKIFNLDDFYTKTKNITDTGHIILKSLFNCGEYSAFAIYEHPCAGDSCCYVTDLKTYLDNKYSKTTFNVIYEIDEDMSGGWNTFQTIANLKDKINNM